MTKLVCTTCGEVHKAPFRPERSDLECECGGRRVLPSQAKPRKPLRRVSEKREGEARRRGSTLRRGKGFEASKAQRDKVRGLTCLGCGREESATLPIDPAHIWPRGKGGCDDAACVVPLCRTCHRAFDQGALDLLERMAGSEAWQVEQAHPILAHGVGLVELVRRLSADSYSFVKSAETPQPQGHPAPKGES